MSVDMQTVVPIAKMKGENAEETLLLRNAFAEASSFLRAFEWCSDIKEAFFGRGIGGVVAVFLFRIEPLGSVDEWLWVVTGDLPSAYLVADDAPTPVVALELYCELMDDWVAAVRGEKSLSEVFPVVAVPTMESANMLRERLEFLRNDIIPTLV